MMQVMMNSHVDHLFISISLLFILCMTSAVAMSSSVSERTFLLAQQCAANLLALYEEQEDRLNMEAICSLCRCPVRCHRVSYDDPPASSSRNYKFNSLAELALLYSTNLYYAQSLSGQTVTSISPSPTLSSLQRRLNVSARFPSRSVASFPSPLSTLPSSSRLIADETLVSSLPTEFDEEDLAKIEEEERKAYASQDRKDDSDPEGDKTPEDEDEDNDITGQYEDEDEDEGE